jgi:hypothetical protein
MNHQEVCQQYKVNDENIITSPGKFEGEPTFSVFFWDAGLSGFADGIGDDGEFFFDVDDEDRAKFPGLEGIKRLAIWVDDNGFVTVSEWRKPRQNEDYYGVRRPA